MGEEGGETHSQNVGAFTEVHVLRVSGACSISSEFSPATDPRSEQDRTIQGCKSSNLGKHENLEWGLGFPGYAWRNPIDSDLSRRSHDALPSEMGGISHEPRNRTSKQTGAAIWSFYLILPSCWTPQHALQSIPSGSKGPQLEWPGIDTVPATQIPAGADMQPLGHVAAFIHPWKSALRRMPNAEK